MSRQKFHQALTAPSGDRRRIYLMGCRVGWGGVGWDGVDGTEDQMGPSIFFILCGYIVHIYMSLARSLVRKSPKIWPFFEEINVFLCNISQKTH